MTDMYALKNELLKILDFIEDKEDVVFVDYPLHHNIGDLLILLGTISFFENNSLNVKSHLSTYNTNIELLSKQITPKTTILCHGGGNFGDIYPIHQNLREQIIESFPNNRVIIFPQTACFNSIESQDKSQGVFKKHDNIVMFARDKKTHEMFKQFSNKAYLMPDMAHELYGTLPKSNTLAGKFYFLRNDIEKTPLPVKLQQKVQNQDYYDWSDLLDKTDSLAAYAVMKMIRVNSKLKSNILDEMIFKVWKAHTKALTLRMAKKFSIYNRVITSRLHGHILSCLVDVPSVIIDNSYGKNTAYYELWTERLEIASLWEK